MDEVEHYFSVNYIRCIIYITLYITSFHYDNVSGPEAVFGELCITNSCWWILKYHMPFLPGVNHCHGRISSVNLASWQAETYDHHWSVPSGCVRPHFGERCGEKTNAGNYLWLTSCSFVLGVESVPTAVPSREHSSSKSFSVLDDTLVQMVEALRYKP